MRVALNFKITLTEKQLRFSTVTQADSKLDVNENCRVYYITKTSHFGLQSRAA